MGGFPGKYLLELKLMELTFYMLPVYVFMELSKPDLENQAILQLSSSYMPNLQDKYNYKLDYNSKCAITQML